MNLRQSVRTAAAQTKTFKGIECIKGGTVVLEVVEVDAVQGSEAAFEQAYREAAQLLKRAKGFVSMQLVRGIEVPNRYRVLVQWQNLESHTRGFRESPDYEAVIALTRPHAASRALVQHYELVVKE
jgi:heme-degrading monooxygenase HmoA